MMKNIGGIKKLLVFAAFVMMSLLCAPRVNASNITFNSLGPHEYTLPVNYESFNAVAQYSFIQNDSMAFNNDGKRVSGPDTFTAVGFTKYFRFFTLKALPDVGFAWGAIIPEISIQKTGFSASGLGDPLTVLAVWRKPSPNSTVGIQSYLSVPVGNEQVSDKTWANLTSLFGDLQMGNINIDGHTGFVYKSLRHQTGMNDVDPGTAFHANLRLGYSVNQYLEPYLAVDYQTVGASKDDLTGKDIPFSDSNEMTMGAGLMGNFTDSINLSVRYDYGLVGKNTPVSNALHFKFAYIW